MKKLTPQNKNKIRELYVKGVKVKDIAKRYGVNRQTVYRVTKDLVPYRYHVDIGRQYRKALISTFLLSIFLVVVVYVVACWFKVISTLPPSVVSPIFLYLVITLTVATIALHLLCSCLLKRQDGRGNRSDTENLTRDER